MNLLCAKPQDRASNEAWVPTRIMLLRDLVLRRKLLQGAGILGQAIWVMGHISPSQAPCFLHKVVSPISL